MQFLLLNPPLHTALRLLVIYLPMILMMVGSLPSAHAQLEISPPAGKPLPPRKPLISMDEKVAMADHIFIGTGGRIYYVDKLYREVDYELANTLGRYSVSAILELEVERTLYPLAKSAPKIARLLVNGSKEPLGDNKSS